MMQKLLQLYECKILNERSKRNLGKFGWTYIILAGVCLISFLVCEWLRKDVGAISSSIALLVVSIVFIIIANKIIQTNESDVVKFKEETVDKFTEILKNVGIDNEDTITVIIDQCKEFEKDTKTSMFSGERFKSVLTLLIYPILAAVVSVIVSKKSDEDMVAWAIFIIGMIIIIYVMLALIAPVISDFVNKYKNMARMMRQDLEYIRVIMQNSRTKK